MEKLSLSSVKSFLSREEMRNVFGGNEPMSNSPGMCSNNCSTVDASCDKPKGGKGICRSFHCDGERIKGCL